MSALEYLLISSKGGLSLKVKFTKEQLRAIYEVCSQKELYRDWNEVADILNKRFGTEYNESTFRKIWQYFDRMYDACKDICTASDDGCRELDVKMRQFKKEKQKLQTEKLEYNRWLREEAREEMIVEQILHSISTLAPVVVPPITRIAQQDERAAVLCLADAHFNTEFEIKGIYNEIINAYSPEIFYQRMWYLRDRILELCEHEHITKLYIFDLGDDNDGLLRLTDNLIKLRWGVIDSTIIYAEFMANWLNEISKKVNLEFQMVVDSNHNQLRLCSAPKNAFKNENLSKVIMSVLKSRLQDNPYITIVQNPTGYIFSNIEGYNIMGIHGETKSLRDAMDNLSRLYGIRINYLLGGHKHHSEEYGFDCEGISVGSIIGVDEYSVHLMRSANASSTMLLFEQGKGLVTKHCIKLN